MNIEKPDSLKQLAEDLNRIQTKHEANGSLYSGVADCYRCMMASRALFGNGDALCDLDSSGPGTRAKLADLIEGNEQ